MHIRTCHRTPWKVVIDHGGSKANMRTRPSQSVFIDIILNHDATKVDCGIGHNYDAHNVKQRGKAITSYIAGELTKRPQTVVFLEHIDKADARAEESESDTVSDTKDVWLEEFLQQMDEKVVIEPFDFDSHRAGGVEKWIDSVLYRGLMEAREKQGGVSGTMMKLAAVQGVTIEEDDALCSCLPSRIIIGCSRRYD
ncbi:hypothetical protein Tco_0178186 [Tanacetum coccineum]